MENESNHSRGTIKHHVLHAAFVDMELLGVVFSETPLGCQGLCNR